MDQIYSLKRLEATIMYLKLLFVSISWNGHSIVIRFNEEKLLITKTGCQTFCWLFLEEIDCTTCLAPIFILLKLLFLDGFCCFFWIPDQEWTPKDSLLDSFKQMPSLKNWMLDDCPKTNYVKKQLYDLDKDTAIDILYTYTHIITFMYICICYVFYVVI